jgi:hypothetical protein
MLLQECVLNCPSGDRKLPLNRRQHVFPNGTLLIENVQRAGDHGLYTCTATNKQHLAASQTVSLSVIGECVCPRAKDQQNYSRVHVCIDRLAADLSAHLFCE